MPTMTVQITSKIIYKVAIVGKTDFGEKSARICVIPWDTTGIFAQINTLVICYIIIEHGPVEIIDVPLLNMVDVSM